MTRPSFVIELAADAGFARDLAAGGVFVPARGFTVMDELDLVVQGASGELCLHARVVYIDPDRGTGLEIVGFGPEIKEQLAQLASTPAEIAAVSLATTTKRPRVLTRPGVKRSPQARDIEMLELDDLDAGADADDHGDLATTGRTNARGDIDDGHDDHDRIASERIADDDRGRIDDGDPRTHIAEDTGDRIAGDNRTRITDDNGDHGGRIDDASDDLAIATAGDDSTAPPDLDNTHAADPPNHDSAPPNLDGEGTARTTGRIALNANERLRGLSLADQMKVARGPSASERMALERMYGKNVWEALLHNPGLTVPEVARLARLGTLPRTLLELIVSNNTWLQVPEVRRALLANPRLGTDQISRVLRLLPKHELKLAVNIPAYPHTVRSIAKRMLDAD